MKKLVLGALFSVLVVLIFSGQAEAKKSYTVKNGDCLSVIGAELNVDWHKIAKINGIKPPYVIYPDQKLFIPEPDEYFDVKELGRNPFRGVGDYELGWKQFNLSADEIAELNEKIASDNFAWKSIRSGDVFNLGLEGNNILRIKPRMWIHGNDHHNEAARVYELATGTEIWIALKCGNPYLRKAKKEAPKKLVAKPKPEIELPKLEMADLTDNEKYFFWSGERIDSYASTGLVKGHGNRTRWNYADIALYPIAWDTKDFPGKHYLGVGYSYTNWYGHAGDGFKFKGRRELWKPLMYKIFNWESHYDWGAYAAIGRHRIKGHSKDELYKMAGKFRLAGPGIFSNWYNREAQGKKLFPETQVWGSILFVYDRDAKHFWSGNSINNTNDLENFDYLVDIGIRQFIYNKGWIRTYAEAEFLGELPKFKNLNLALGVSDKWKLLFADAGVQLNLSSGDEFFIADIGIDVGRMLGLGIEQYCASKVKRKLEVKYGEFTVDKTGAVVFK